MKKGIIGMSMCLLLGACSSPQQFGATVSGIGAGGMLGASVGGLAGHTPRSRDLGRLIGGVAGGVVGATVTAPRERSVTAEPDSRKKQRRQRRDISRDDYAYDDVYGMASDGPTYRQDDRVAGGTSVVRPASEMPDVQAVMALPVQLNRLQYMSHDGAYLKRNGRGQVVFELKNTSPRVQRNIVVYLAEMNGNEAIVLSPPTPIERLMPGQAVRYTAHIAGGRKLKDGTADVSIAVSSDEFPFTTVRVFSLETHRI